MNYIVYGPGRTGSLMIAGDLSRALPGHKVYYSPGVQRVIDEVTGAAIIHTHNANQTVIDRSNYTAIISRRKDEFATAVSAMTAEYTKQFGPYTSSDFKPFVANVDQFNTTIHYIRDFYHRLDLKGYPQVFDIWYEDMIEDTFYLRRACGLGHTPMEYYHHRSPFGMRLILNLEELHKEYQRMNK